MPLKLGPRTFQVEHATIEAALLRPYWNTYDPTITDTVGWFLSVACTEKEFDGEEWKPEFDFQQFALPIERWRDLEGLTASVEGGTCYVVGHGAVGRTEVRVGKRTGSRFLLTCQGVCDVDWDDEFGQDVPFTLTTRVRFESIRVVGTSDDDDDSLRAFLAAHLRLDGLVEQPCEQDGTPKRSRKKMLAKMFLPGRVSSRT
jgi:hypothetical protein